MMNSGEVWGGRIFQSSMHPSIHIFPFILSIAIFTHSVSPTQRHRMHPSSRLCKDFRAFAVGRGGAGAEEVHR